MKNPEISNLKTQVLSDNWSVLNKVSFDFRLDNLPIENHKREVYDRGNGAAILLYNEVSRTVILTRQFRLPTYLNGNATGMLIEVCAGMLDLDAPEQCVIREAEEETGYRVSAVTKVMETYMSPGAVTEILHLFVGKYDSSMRVNDGGGLDTEQEHIEVLEMLFEDAFKMIATGAIKDAKTILLLQYALINKLVL